MRKSIFSLVAAAVLLSGSVLAQDKTTTKTTTWTNEQGTVIREYSKTKKYSSQNDPKIEIRAGAVLPSNVTIYALPENAKVPESDRYNYGIVNDRPVVVEKETRTIIHSWEK